MMSPVNGESSAPRIGGGTELSGRPGGGGSADSLGRIGGELWDESALQRHMCPGVRVFRVRREECGGSCFVRCGGLLGGGSGLLVGDRGADRVHVNIADGLN